MASPNQWWLRIEQYQKLICLNQKQRRNKRVLKSCENSIQDFLGQKGKRQVPSHWDKPKKEKIATGLVVGNPVTQ